MPEESLTVNAAFVAPITVSGSLTMRTKGLAQLDKAFLFLYSDASYQASAAPVISLSSSISPASTTNGVTTYQPIPWSVKLAPSAAAKPYYAKLSYGTSGEAQLEKQLGLLFSAGNATVSAGTKTVDLGIVTIHGTLSATLNGASIYSDSTHGYFLRAYPNDTYTGDPLGETPIAAPDGAWSLLIPDTYSTVYFMLLNNNNGSYRLGVRAVTTNAIALNGTFTAKIIGGTVSNTGGITASAKLVMILDGTASTFADVVQKVNSGEIAKLALEDLTMIDNAGAWKTSVMSDIVSAYVLVILDDNTGYITKNKVTLTTSTTNLDIADMSNIGAAP
jgi:hypothetical protein